jgi:hypothetical protein
MLNDDDDGDGLLVLCPPVSRRLNVLVQCLQVVRLPSISVPMDLTELVTHPLRGFIPQPFEVVSRDIRMRQDSPLRQLLTLSSIFVGNLAPSPLRISAECGCLVLVGGVSLPPVPLTNVGLIDLVSDLVPAIPASKRRCRLERPGVARKAVLQPISNLEAMPDQRVNVLICLVASKVTRNACNRSPDAVDFHLFVSRSSGPCTIEVVHLGEAVNDRSHSPSKIEVWVWV